MSTRPVEPRGNAGGPLTPYVLLGTAWAAIGMVWLAWLSGRIATVLTGRPWDTGPPFGGPFVQGLLRGDWATLWPDVPPLLVAAVYGLTLAVVLLPTVGGWLWWLARRPSADDPLRSLATPRDIEALTLPAVTSKARRLRPSLAHEPGKHIAPESAGVALGTLRRRTGRSPALYASWEDVVLAVMAPRAAKTTALAVPAVLHAPGAAIATSNKSDLWATTAALRAEHGRVWVFDPQQIAHVAQEWWWNPLTVVRDVESAHRLADHFIQQIRNEHQGDDFWSMGALDLLTSLILAAATSGGTLLGVQRWLSDSTSRVPAGILHDAGYLASARALTGRQAGAPETREGIYETARTAAACLANPAIMAWVTPPTRPIPALDVAGFARTADTVYLLSKDGAGNAAPLVAGLTDQILRAAVQAAEVAGGRLDPPLIACLDEAANICKIRDLPDQYSHLGSRGVVAITILQSYRQGTRVWGERGMDALWSAATCKLVGAGIDDARFAEDLSRLVGDHDVAVASRTRGSAGHDSWQTSTRRQRILDAAHVRALPKGTALLLATGMRAALITLQPWFEGPLAARLTQAVAASTEAMKTSAQAKSHTEHP
ncbi:type IV secretory system conjugative DNA transfer family protein [Micromonospora andamanensis]|uniref:TraD/TraG TraM recognition site domain-containing protein n=1 Tax=Micromonospora andamanensis TaxID=1287068 RepID=A0ABQ4I2V2_9ACTN|nr:type IV secretory system conjugative DNA transfer family protein [Micromonospora andamanensis]GIJ12213.1 hypothetical protein Van01_54270 [Micromonospora andamanensis]